MRRTREKNNIPTGVEIKGPGRDLGVTAFREYREQVLIGLEKAGCTAHAITVKKANMQERLRKAHQNILYNYTAGLLLLDYLATLPKEQAVAIILDRRCISAKRGFKIDDYLRTGLWIERQRPDISLTLRHEESARNYGVQAVHLIANAVFRSYERGDSAAANALGSMAVENRELFFAE